MFDDRPECPFCNATPPSEYGFWKSTPHHPECPSQYRPRTAAHNLPLTNAAGDVESPLETTPAESE